MPDFLHPQDDHGSRLQASDNAAQRSLQLAQTALADLQCVAKLRGNRAGSEASHQLVESTYPALNSWVAISTGLRPRMTAGEQR
jgi:hypothetical protein